MSVTLITLRDRVVLTKLFQSVFLNMFYMAGIHVWCAILQTIDSTQILKLNEYTFNGDVVVYIMSRD